MSDVRAFLIVLIACLLWNHPALAGAAELELQPPVPGRVMAVFDVEVTRFSAGHRGADLAAAPGEAVRASAAGTVHFVGSVAGRPSLSVDHGGGVRTTYTPAVGTVARGQAVAQGEVIGTVGVDDHCRSACLHWGLTDGTDHFDPMAHVAASTIRLLPHGATPKPRPRRVGVLPRGGLPVSGSVSSAFGMRTHPITGIHKLHDGTDIAAACGTPVAVPWPGRVVSASFDSAYGYRIIVDHVGVRTGYAHLRGLEVRAGAHLAAGARLGSVGSTGMSTGCHLHWMAWRNGALIDPSTLVS